MVLLLSENDIKRLRQLLKQKIMAGASAKSIVAQLRKAINGDYNAKGFTQRDRDKSELELILGGPRLL